ncbi:MAG TPA: hypothetical protein VMZ71_08075 [Gemmataceae bacterium]|nr:hypothetical protein [Gemmataceae bacterium]
MTKRIRVTSPAPKVIRDTSTPLPHLSHDKVTAGLGAEPSDQKLEDALSPITLFAVRSELMSRLQSSGGRPALTGTSRRAKVPLGDSDWQELEELAAVVSGPGFYPTAGQIASVLLSLSIRAVTSQVARSPKPASSPLARDLAARSATELAKRITRPCT